MLLFVEGQRGAKRLLSLHEAQELMVRPFLLGCSVTRPTLCFSLEYFQCTSVACAMFHSPALLSLVLQMGCGVSMPFYLVYCKLMRAGYIAQRWGD